MHTLQCISAVFSIWVFLACLPAGQTEGDIKVAAFNIQVFGKAKARKDKVMVVLQKIVRRYDVILIQEIREITKTAITKLMKLITSQTVTDQKAAPMQYLMSSRLGRSSSKEQYAFIYNTNRLKKINTYQFEDKDDYFEREPYCVIFKSTGKSALKFGLVGIHVKPSDAVNEINNLTLVYDQIVSRYHIKDVIMMGDFNADCDYVRKSEWPSVTLRSNRTFTWLLDDTMDTTVKRSNCAYDRFVIAGDTLKAAIVNGSAGVFKFDKEYGLSSTTEPTAADVSDHYPIELKIKDEPVGPDSSAAMLRMSWFSHVTAVIMTLRYVSVPT